jgi:hypothetical protein
MAQPFSDETQELLDRAQRAIDRSILLREHTQQCIAEAKRRLFQIEMAHSQLPSWLCGPDPRAKCPIGNKPGEDQ